MLADAIQRSLLLREEQKDLLLEALPRFSPERQTELATLLEREAGIVDAYAAKVIGRAVQEGDSGFLDALNVFLKRSIGPLFTMQEKFERGEEEQEMEHFFDDRV
ncbi:hypothetical protein HY285_01095 [Candidatus Peregrinibacteria bacterium]|nr:hypothetical protein [Candidatus Peregrinibacteria bacterium]